VRSAESLVVVDGGTAVDEGATVAGALLVVVVLMTDVVGEDEVVETAARSSD
jgi:hypothetical protein